MIAGGGIGGLATALCLHQAGIEAEIFEQSAELRELGVGMNVLPHAIAVLAGLGLLPALDRVGIRTRELIYCNRFGQTVWQRAARHRRGIRCAAVQHPPRQAPGRAASRGGRPPGRRRGSIPGAGWRVSASAGQDHGVLRKPERWRARRGRRRRPGRRRRHPFHGPRDPPPGRGCADLERRHAVARRDRMAGPSGRQDDVHRRRQSREVRLLSDPR